MADSMSRYVSHDGTPRETGEGKEKHEQMKAEDLTGKKFGDEKAVEIAISKYAIKKVTA